MKKKLLITGMAISLGSLLFLAPNAVTAKANPVSSAFALKQERINLRLEKILANVDAQVQAQVTAKFEEKKAILAEAEAKAQAAQAAEAAAQEEAAKAQAATEQQAAAATPPPVSEAPATQAPEASAPVAEPDSNGENPWKTAGEDFGNRLSNPDLTDAERQAIINEKKNYYQNH